MRTAAVLNVVAVVLVILSGVNAFLDLVKIPPWLTYVGSLVVAAFACFFWVRRRERIMGLTRRQSNEVCSALVVVFFLLWVPRAMELLFEPPKVAVTLKPEFSRFAPGTVVDGITWQPEFRRYTLAVRTLRDVDVDTNDLRIDFRIPGAVIDYKLNAPQGTEPVNFFQRGFELCGPLVQNGVISRLVKMYVNDLQIATNKLHPGGGFEVKLIVKVDPDWPQPGMMETKYSYRDKTGNKISETARHRIFVKDKYNARTLAAVKDDVPAPTMYAAIFDEPYKYPNGLEVAALFLSTSPDSPGALYSKAQ